MQLEIITPETEIFKGDVNAVQFPGLDGSFQVLNGHAPIISALSKGDVKVNLVEALSESDTNHELVREDSSDRNVIRVAIKGGVMEMLNNKIIVLAE